MPLIVFNTARSSVAGESAIYVAERNETIIFGRSAFWTATHFNALEIVGSTTVQVSGELYAEDNAIYVVGSFNSISVTRTGILHGESYGIVSDEGTTRISNAGSISGYFGIETFGDGNSVFNEGTITGEDDAIRFFLATTDNNLTNIGQIVSHIGDGVTFSGGQSHRVINSGIISAADRAISGSSTGALNVDNSGTLDGDVAIGGGGGADRVVNTGTLIGLVNLFGGDDFLDSSQGFVNGFVRGEAGNDILYGGFTDDVIDGGTGDDTLAGNAGNDRLTGGAGADDLDGGAGTDGARYDTATTAVVADLAGTIANGGDAAGDTFTGIENLVGGNFNDALYGDTLGNRLTGGLGNDLLDGRAGADVLRGGDGGDLYFVDNSGDRVVELFGDGSDTVSAAIDFALPDFVEALTLTGSAAINGFGNALDNRITGNSAANTIDGEAGFDILVGGGGADRFRFTSELIPANSDSIEDFAVGIDRLVLSRSIFTNLSGPVLPASRFAVGTAAQDAADRIVYDPASGALFYDPDGTGSAAQILFAGVDAGLLLTASDFQLIG